MPTFYNYEVEVNDEQTYFDVDFEVFCGTCGAGLCNVSDTRKSRSRGYAQVTVEACPDCMKRKDEEIKDLELRIKELEEENDHLDIQIYDLKQELRDVQ
jgi:predicted RNase H-like nuclease (RuvC/YqgF family)